MLPCDAIKDIYQDVYGNIWIARNAYTELVTGIKDDKLVSNKNSHLRQYHNW